MGANGSSPYSQGSDDPRLYIGDKDRSEHHRLQYHGLLHYRGKPSPPEGTPSIRDITENSMTVLWTLPFGFPARAIIAFQVEVCNVRKDRQWKVVTSCCQGTSYVVKNLTPDTEYMFRVRAENAFGKSKPSPTTAIVRTRELDRRPRSDSDSKNKLVRRHSYSVKMEDGVMTLVHNRNNQSNYSSIQRNSAMRSSLPILRRSSTSILPGSNRQSVCSIREKRRSVEESTVCSDDDGSGSVQGHRVSMSTEDDSCTRSLSTASIPSIPEEDETCDSKVVDDFTWKSQDSWKSTDSQTISRDILSGPFSDEQKMDLFSKSDSCFKTFKDTTNEDIWKNRQSEEDHIMSISDLKSLRQVLKSNDMYVRTLGASDDNGNFTNNLNRDYFPYPIKEVEEEDDDLALDIVSSI